MPDFSFAERSLSKMPHILGALPLYVCNVAATSFFVGAEQWIECEARSPATDGDVGLQLEW